MKRAGLLLLFLFAGGAVFYLLQPEKLIHEGPGHLGQPPIPGSPARSSEPMLPPQDRPAKDPNSAAPMPAKGLAWEAAFPGLAGYFAFPAGENNKAYAQRVLARLRGPLGQSRFWAGRANVKAGGKVIPARFLAVFSDLKNRRSPDPLRTLSEPGQLSWNVMGIFSVGDRFLKGNLSATAEAIPRKDGEYFLYLDCRAYESIGEILQYVALPLPGKHATAHFLARANEAKWAAVPLDWAPVEEGAYREFLEQWDRADY